MVKCMHLTTHTHLWTNTTCVKHDEQYYVVLIMLNETHTEVRYHNTFTAKQFSENHRFSLKIFKTLEGHNSLNFGRRRKFQTFLESSDKNLSKKWRFVSSYLNQKNVQSWKREKSPKTSILDEISRLGTERVNEVRWKIFFVLKRVFFDQATSKNNF